MRALALFVLVWATPALAQMVVVMSRSGYVREARNSSSDDCYHAQAGDSLLLLDEDFTNGYYHVQASNGCTGFVYRSLGRRPPVSDPPVWAGGGSTTGPTAPGAGPRWLNACSFNMKFPGIGGHKEYQAMVEMLRNNDLVLVQELAAAPEPMSFDGVTLQPTVQSREFFNLMRTAGFSYALSSAKTGPNVNTENSNKCEYFVAFYKPDVLEYRSTSSGFISAPLTGHGTFDRVPWRFDFNTRDRTLDFAVTNVHLKQEDGEVDGRRRELALIAQLNAAHPEDDQLIIGDMNFQRCAEMQSALPPGYASLNDDCAATNVGQQGKPFDHVLYLTGPTGNDIDRDYFNVIDLNARMRPTWTDPDEAFPECPPTNANTFAKFYSDHKPVEFRLRYGVRDDDN